MTKEITKAYIIQEIEDKFKLREYEAAKFLFGETVVPIYNIEGHLTFPQVATKTISVTSSGGKTIATVPDNERWNLNRYTVVFMAAGAYKVAGVYVTRNNYPAAFLYLDLTKNQTESYAVDLPKGVMLHSGDSIAINIDDYTSTANIMINYDYSREMTR